MPECDAIFVNPDAVKINELFLNEGWQLSPLFEDNFVHTIVVNGKTLPWLVKSYDKKKYALRESNNLKSLSHVKGVPRILASGISEKTVSFVIMSRAPGMDLFEHVEKYGTMDEEEVKKIALQLLHILVQMHKQKIIHRDIKPENIIYERKTETVTLIDFEGKYTEKFCSPEQVNNKPVTEKTDLWSVGATLYYLMKGNAPFKNEKQVVHKEIKFPKTWSEEFRDFLSCLIEREVDIRYDAEEALSHCWISE